MKITLIKKYMSMSEQQGINEADDNGYDGG